MAQPPQNRGWIFQIYSRAFCTRDGVFATLCLIATTRLAESANLPRSLLISRQQGRPQSAGGLVYRRYFTGLPSSAATPHVLAEQSSRCFPRHPENVHTFVGTDGANLRRGWSVSKNGNLFGNHFPRWHRERKRRNCVQLAPAATGVLPGPGPCSHLHRRADGLIQTQA